MSLNAQTMSQIGEFLIALMVLARRFAGCIECIRPYSSAGCLHEVPCDYEKCHAGRPLDPCRRISVFHLLPGACQCQTALGIVFVFITGPVAGHLNGRAAYRSGVSMWENSVHDDLKPELKRERERMRASRKSIPRGMTVNRKQGPD